MVPTGGHTPNTLKGGLYLKELIKLKTAAHVKDTLLPFPEFKKIGNKTQNSLLPF